jgi:hypothetical protein
MDGTQFVVSMIGGGLAGGCVNTAFNRIFYWRSLRIRFYPKLSHMFSAYRIRMENPEGRYWITTVGKVPLPEDAAFVQHHVSFLSELIDFTELKEARALRKQLLSHMFETGSETKGTVIKIDLTPDSDALLKCLKIVQRKLRLS